MDVTVCVWNLELWILAVSELTLDLHTSIERVFLKLLYYKFINFIFFKTEYQNKTKQNLKYVYDSCLCLSALFYLKGRVTLREKREVFF